MASGKNIISIFSFHLCIDIPTNNKYFIKFNLHVKSNREEMIHKLSISSRRNDLRFDHESLCSYTPIQHCQTMKNFICKSKSMDGTGELTFKYSWHALIKPPVQTLDLKMAFENSMGHLRLGLGDDLLMSFLFFSRSNGISYLTSTKHSKHGTHMKPNVPLKREKEKNKWNFDRTRIEDPIEKFPNDKIKHIMSLVASQKGIVLRLPLVPTSFEGGKKKMWKKDGDPCRYVLRSVHGSTSIIATYALFERNRSSNDAW